LESRGEHKQNNSKTEIDRLLTKRFAAMEALFKRKDKLQPKPMNNDISRSSGKVLVNIYRIIIS